MAERFIDYYDVLGIAFGATDEQIKKGYRAKVKEYHPDMHCTENLSKAEEEFNKTKYNEVSEAYDVLSNYDRKIVYDALYLEIQQRLADETRRREEYREAERQRREREAQERQEESEYEYYEERPTTRGRVSRETFVSKVKKSYAEIRKEEKAEPLSKRHRKLDRRINREIDYDMNLGKRGILHIGFEFIHQLRKLTYINDDNVTKYVIRNRKTIAALVLAGTLISASAKTNVDIPQPDTNDSPSYTTMSPEQPTVSEQPTIVVDPQTDITLTRYYTVASGDTLSGLSSESNTTISKIKSVNNLKTDIIYIGQELKIPYYIKNYELQYFTESISVDGKTLSQIAEERHTDVATLLRLNDEAIVKTEDGKYMILSYEIKVPKFITQEELRAAKEARQYK